LTKVAVKNETHFVPHMLLHMYAGVLSCVLIVITDWKCCSWERPFHEHKCCILWWRECQGEK